MGKLFTKLGLAAAATLMTAAAYAQFNPTAPLPRALMSHTAVTLDGRVYVAGGVGDLSSSDYLNNVYYCARILDDGELGPWQEASPMPEFLGLGMHASVAHNGRLYVLGGTNLYGPRSVTYYSGVNTDGTLTGWTVTTPLPAKMYAHAASVYGGRIYVTGGIARIYGPRQLTYSAAVNPDGGLGAWRQETPLPFTLFGHSSFARDGRLFVLGGSASGDLYGAGGAPGVSSAVYAAPIGADGALGAWEAQPPLPSGLAFYGLAVSEKSAYLLGGFDGGVTNAVHFAPFTPAGGLGSWTALHALPRNLLSLASVSNGEFLYSLGGGLSYLDDPVRDIYFARLKTDLQAFVKMTPTAINAGANGKWVTAIIGLPEADAGAIDPASVRIAEVNGEAVTPIAPDPKWSAKVQTGDSAEFSGMSGVRYMTLKFSRQAVAAIVRDGEFSIGVEGRLTDGRMFRGSSMNKGVHSSRPAAAAAGNRHGERVGPGGVKVRIPAGAFAGNPELLLSAAPEEDKGPVEKGRRDNGMKARGMAAVSRPFEFGPHGMAFGKPVTISLPYDPASLPAGAEESALKVAYWNEVSGEWEILPSSVSKADRLVSAEVGHFSVYQVLSEVPQTPAEEPAAAEEPEVIEQPAAAEQPPVVEDPPAAREPAVIEQPAATEEPAAAEQPAAIEEPAVVEQPAVVEEQAVVEQPAVIEEPAVVEQPAAIEEPAVVETPAVVEEPAAEQPAVEQEVVQAAAIEEPVAPEQPAAPEEPAAAEEPAVAEPPAAIEEPAVIEQPAAAEDPPAAEEPAVVEQPVIQPPAPAPAPAIQEISLGEVYIFPNPARPGETPKLHISAASGSKASVRVFSASGRLAYETELNGAPGLVGGAPAYELGLRGEFPSGVYYYSAEVAIGTKKLKRAGKFAVIR